MSGTATAGSTFTIGTVPRPLPYAGHLWHLLRRPLDFAASLPSYGDLVQIRLGPQRAWVPCHTELLWQVLTDDRTFDKGGLIFDRARPLIGNGLPICPHDDHRRTRRRLQHGFTADRLETYGTIMEEEVSTLVGGWRPGQVIDAFRAVFPMTLRTLTRTLFSSSVDPVTTEQLQRCASLVIDGLVRRMLLPPWAERLQLPSNRRHEHAIRYLRGARERYAPRDGDGGLLANLTASGPGSPNKLSPEEVDDQVIPFLIAGTETVAVTLAWALHLLAEHTEAEHRLHEEVDSVLAGRNARYEDLPRLPYTARFLNEALRLYPPGWLVTRTTTCPTKLAGQPLPTGSTILFSAATMHRHPALYTNPDAFDPDRWLPERAAALPRGAFIPFGGGARKCIGDSYGMAEAVLTLATITHHWQLRGSPGTDPRPATLATILRPRRILLQLHPREAADSSRAASAQAN